MKTKDKKVTENYVEKNFDSVMDRADKGEVFQVFLNKKPTVVMMSIENYLALKP